MAYRRRQQVGRVDTSPSIYNYDSTPPPADSSASSLAAKAIRASSAYRDSSLSSVYEQSALSSPRASVPSAAKESTIYEHTSKKDMNESKQGFWGALARKAKVILDDNDSMAQKHETPRETIAETSNRSKKCQYHNTYDFSDSRRKTDGPALQRKLDAFASSLHHIGGTIGNALEEGITAVENRTADIIQETRKIQIRKKNDSSRSQNQFSNPDGLRQQPVAQTHAQPQTHTNLETQLKASRDVAMAMAAKAKLLLRELKTVKADLAFAKERCAQLEDENRILRESREKGDNPEDDDLIRLQLESLLAEKARLAQENSVYARENRFLREIVEYHQLTMQDVVYLDESNEEVTEVYIAPTAANVQSHSPTPTVPNGAISLVTTQNMSPISLDLETASQNVNAVKHPYVQMPAAENVVRKH
ncbi:hypothetical protein CASFOL_002868 [Castilleja foliolosa]|uniref:Uncharacterized protein n=1 Tax=Castilleja foliolosa TaxID=1961234 RepID=A0ABD3EFZ1_9LAMI